MLYNKLSEYLKKRYGERVQRLPINAGFTCPNRNQEGKNGCIFCDETGSGFASFDENMVIEKQIEKMIDRYKHKASKYMAYFQSNTNTFEKTEELEKIYTRSLINDKIVILDISTRPDCVDDKKLDMIAKFKKKVDVFIEYGLQSTNTNTLIEMNRGHYLSEAIKAIMESRKREIEVILHFIIDYPKDSTNDVIEMAKFSNVLDIQGVKLHSLYIVRNTVLGNRYINNDFNPLSLEDYINRIILFLEYLSPNIVIHRLAADPPKDNAIHGNWGLSKLQIVNMIEKEMKKRNTFQGRHYKNK